MKRIFLLILVSLLTLALSSPDAQAGTKVAFLKVYNSQGKLIQYEPNSRFGHTALQIGELWLQSYPGEGVQLVTWEHLQKRGVVSEIIELTGTVKFSEILLYLNRPFDFQYSWGDEAFYCSELIAKILKVLPEPMQLNREVWPPLYWHLEGQPGISPDKLYRRLKTPGPYL